MSSAAQAQDAPAAEPSAPATSAPTEHIVVTTSHEASTAVVRLVQLSTEQAEHLVREATEEASRIREDADREATQVTARTTEGELDRPPTSHRVITLIAVVNFRGVSESVRVNVLLTCVELTGLLIIICIGAWALTRGAGDT